MVKDTFPGSLDSLSVALLLRGSLGMTVGESFIQGESFVQVGRCKLALYFVFYSYRIYGRLRVPRKVHWCAAAPPQGDEREDL